MILPRGRLIRRVQASDRVGRGLRRRRGFVLGAWASSPRGTASWPACRRWSLRCTVTSGPGWCSFPSPPSAASAISAASAGGAPSRSRCSAACRSRCGAITATSMCRSATAPSFSRRARRSAVSSWRGSFSKSRCRRGASSARLAMLAGLIVIGVEALHTMGAHGILGDLMFVAAGASLRSSACCCGCGAFRRCRRSR